MDKPNKTHAASNPNLQIYATAFAQMPGLMYLIDHNCVLIACNENLSKLLKSCKLDTKTVGAIYQHLVKESYWTEEQVQQYKHHDIETILSGTSKIDEIQLPVFNHKKEIIYYQATRIPLLGNSGEVAGLLVILWDITHQKQMRDQFEAIKKELQTANSSNAAPIPAAVKSEAPNKTIRVLLIEDNITAQQAAKSILMSCDCIVDIVDNELHFDELFKPGKYDLVFMDIGLENTSGYAFAKQLRKKEQGSDHKVPIIALTGFDPDLVSLDCGYYQMEGAIGKPLKLEQAKQILQRYVHHIDIEVSGLKQLKA